MNISITVASKAIITSENKFLLQLRDNLESISSPNTWGFFGGKIREDESAQDGLKRELLEELNYICFDAKYLCNHFCVSSEVLVNYFYVRINHLYDVKSFYEGQRMEWFTFDEMKTLKKANDLKYALNKNLLESKKSREIKYET